MEKNIGLSYTGEFTVGRIHLRSIDRGINLRHEKVGDTETPKRKKAADPVQETPGFGANGELRIGAITLALSAGGDSLRLRRENVGHQTETDSEVITELFDTVFFSDYKSGEPAEREVAEAAIEGVLEDAFFTRRIERNGAVMTNLDRVLERKA